MNRDPAIFDRLPRVGLAAPLSALALTGGMGTELPGLAYASPVATEASLPACPNSGILAFCKWVPTRVQNVAGTREGGWRDCIGVDNRRHHKLTLNCNIDNTSDHRVTASITGDLNIGIAKLSAVVGYEADGSTNITGSISYPISRRIGQASIQYAPQFGDLKRVTQAQERCINERYMGDRCRRTGKYAVVYTEKYLEPVFRLKTSK